MTMEWPWSPLRLEQRIGRVHRLGQRHVVHAVHLTAASSYEEVVVEHVRRRSDRAEEALRSAAENAEQRVTALVLDLPLARESVENAPAAAEERAVIEVQARREAERVRRARALSLFHTALDEAAWALPRRRVATCRAIVLIQVVRHRAGGGPRDTSVVPVEVTLAGPLRDVRSWRACARRLAREPRVHQAAAGAQARDNGKQWSAARDRLDSLWPTTRSRSPLPLAQPSLFDRRAIRAAEQQQHAHSARERWRAGLRMRLTEAPFSVTTRAVAVLPIGSERR
jgi:hypothetical protein